MKIFAVLLGAALLTTACSENNRTDVSYDRKDLGDEKQSIDASVEEQKETIDANAQFQKERLEAQAEAQKKIMEAEREKAAALENAAERRANATEEINEPAGAELNARGDLDNDSELRLRSSLDIDDNRDVSLHMENGLLTLRGVVNSQEEKTDLEARAKAFPGVERVSNQLRVR